jgi:hypothetical protein
MSEPAPTVAFDVFGENARAQIIVYDAHEEPAIHARLSADLQRVVEVVVRKDIHVVRDGALATQWERERDGYTDAVALSMSAEPEPQDNSMWLVELSTGMEVVHVRVGDDDVAKIYVPGIEEPLKYRDVMSWVMLIVPPDC